MAVSIVVGGQYGSCGKGKVALWWAEKIGAKAVVRVGGVNSGHTVYSKDGNKHVFRMLPSASILENIVSILPAGAYIDVQILLDEIAQEGISAENLKIDPNAIIIGKGYAEKEKNSGLKESIGSTLSGTGAAVLSRVGRVGSVYQAKDCVELFPYITDTKKIMREMLDKGHNIVIEGTQGYGLSNIHAKYYPMCTSRDTTAAGFLSETGLSPFDVDHVIMVIRSLPIRVGGNSGPLYREINWEIVSLEGGYGETIEEYTTVTKRKRRVGRFDAELVREAISANRPDIIVMNHCDYLDYQNRGSEKLSEKQEKFISEVEASIGAKISYIGNGENIIIQHNLI